ncbi:hypothetical protein Tco_0200178 [Tanacetum coccineum]
MDIIIVTESDATVKQVPRRQMAVGKKTKASKRQAGFYSIKHRCEGMFGEITVVGTGDGAVDGAVDGDGDGDYEKRLFFISYMK